MRDAMVVAAMLAKHAKAVEITSSVNNDALMAFHGR